ncbi:MAG: hypothetical protein J6T72_03725 [Alphaproteobacteria bacterium]|nr:hypothetical protein [Alphaproteobacteria bacterium]
MIKLSVDDENEFLQSSTEREVLEYIKSCWLYATTEHWLLKNASDKVIKQLVTRWILSPSGEIILIERGNASLIKSYCDKASFGEGGQIALIKRGRHNEIMFYISKYKNLSPSALSALRKRGNKKELATYNTAKETAMHNAATT